MANQAGWDTFINNWFASPSHEMEHAQQVGTTSGQGGLSVVPKPNPSKHVEWVRSLLKRRMVIRVKDGKYYTGLFSCMDKQGNIILEDAEENTPLNTEPHDYSKKHMSLAFIPVTTHKHIHMESPIGEQCTENLLPQPPVSQPAATTCEPPYAVRVKISHKGVILEEDKSFGLGLIGRDINGKILGWKQVKVGLTMRPVEAEAYALREALSFAIERDWTGVVLESDYRDLVEMVNTADADADSSSVREVIQYIKSMLSKMGSYRILYAPRVRDIAAFNLAKNAKCCDEGLDTLPDMEVDLPFWSRK